MIQKVILFGDMPSKDFEDFWNKSTYVFLKTSALLRLGNALHKEGFEVKQIHHCTSFTRTELDHILETFSQGEKVLICISSSFLSSVNRLDYVFHADESQQPIHTVGGFWGDQSFQFLKNIGILSKKYKFPVLMGGFDVLTYKFTNPHDVRSWGLEVLNLFVDYFVVGYNHKIIVNYCKGAQIKHFKLEFAKGNFAKIVNAGPITDWDDYAFTPTPGTYISPNEALVTQIAGGCVFSCSFCTYQGLGKKAHEYCRTYESFKNEIVYNWENSRTRTYMIVDNMINDDWGKLNYLIRIRDETGIDVRWGAYARLDTIRTKEQARMFRDAGASGIIFGIESMKKEVGPYIGKMTESDKIKEHLYRFRDAVGETCMTSGSFIAGAPTETKEELKQTFDWLNSNEGNHLLDHYIFTPLFVEPGINERTEINKKRQDPWRDYTFSDNEEIRMRGTGWISPWGTYDEFVKLAIKYSDPNNQSRITEDSMSAKRGVFAIPIISNLLEGGVEEYINNVRKKLPIHNTHRHIFRENNKKLLEDYRKRTLGNYYDPSLSV